MLRANGGTSCAYGAVYADGASRVTGSGVDVGCYESAPYMLIIIR